MMNLTLAFRRIGSGGLAFHRPSFSTGFGGSGYIGKNGLSEKKISWLTLDFAWLSVDIGNSLWTG